MDSEDVRKKQSELLESKQANTIQTIKTLAEHEKHMFNNLQKLNNKNDPNGNQKKIIEKKVNELSSMRMNLFKKLKSMYSDTQASTHSNRKDLADQLTVVSVMEEELNNIKNRLSQLKSEKSNKIRMVQLGDYEYDRYNAHKKIFKTIVYGAFILLILSYVMRFPWFPTKIGVILVLLILAWIVISTAGQIYDNARRDNIDYDKYDQGQNDIYNGEDASGIGSTGFFDRNSAALKKLFDNKCKSGFTNMGSFTKVVIPQQQPTTYAPISIF
tara:strand:+ start:3339 stop:4151 length:813 start_codon:yes stop_codon:yes gene_type:complete